MKILICTHHLKDKAGSELFTKNLSIELKKRGYEVYVFSPTLGEVSEEIKSFSIRVVDNLLELKNKNFDIIHSQHNATTILARSVFPNTPIIFMSHGVLPELEQPPSVELGICKYIAVSEEVQNNLVKKGILKDKIEIVRNFVDTERFKIINQPNEVLKNILVLSNHYSGEIKEKLEKVSEELGLNIVHVGLPENSVNNVEDYINQADLVITLGRGALESMSCGRNVLVYDIHGADGMVDENNFFEIRKNNFSGRKYSLGYSVEDLKKELSTYNKKNGLNLRKLILKENSIDVVLSKLEKIYLECMGTKPEGNQIREGQLFNEINFLERCFNNLQNSLDLVNKFKKEIGEKDLNTEDFDSKLEEREEIIKQRENEINAILNSTSWKITKPVRKTKNLIIVMLNLIKKGLLVIKREGFVFFIKKTHRYLSSRFIGSNFKEDGDINNKHEFIGDSIYCVSNDGVKHKDVLNQIDTYFKNNRKETLLLISHDASASGVPILTSDIIKVLNKTFDKNVITVVMRGGPIEKEFEKGGLLINLNQKSFNNLNKTKEIDLIFNSIKKYGVNNCICNSVVSGILVPFLEKNHFDYINLIHEQASTIKNYYLYDALNNIVNKSKKIVFSSSFVKNELSSTFNRKLIKSIVYPQGLYFRNKLSNNKELAQYLLRKKLNIPENSKIILSCGHADIRKGFDLFYDVAKRVHQISNKEFHFVWLGDRDEILAKQLKVTSLSEKFSELIHLCDFDTDPSIYFAAADVFLLTSREDPLPMVVLMAMDCGVPVVAFDEAGGSPELLKKGAGLVVPYLNTESMSNEIIKLLDNKKLCGSISVRAKEIIDNNFDFNKYVEFLLSLFDNKTSFKCDKKPKVDLKVSVVVPNYNYEKFLEERLYSIICQTYKPFEIIFLDDNSNDNSIQLAERFLSKTDIPYRIIKNNTNMGCFKQWARGIKEAEGDLIWIAEADDSCKLNLLEVLVDNFSDPEVGLAYVQSMRMNELGDKESICFPYVENNRGINDRWRKDYTNSGLDEIREYLFEKNIIVNASAVLMRRDLLLELGNKIGGSFNMAGDWYTYIQILKGSKIAFSSEVLNYHRYHDNTIVSRSGNIPEEKAKKLVSEILDMHNFIFTNFLISPKYLRLAYEHLKFVCQNHLMKDPESFSEFRSKLEIYKINEANSNKKILFFSTNDHWGGSEIACATLAQSFSEAGWNVTLVMNKHTPRPDLLDNISKDRSISFYEREAKDYCRSSETSNFVIGQKPDIIFISQGHVFESIELMQWCKKHNIKYVNFIPLVTEYHLSFFNDLKLIKESSILLKRSKKIFIDNNNSIKVMQKMLGVSLNNFQVIHNGFDVKYNQEFSWNKPINNEYKLAFVGRLEAVHKGLDILLKVFSSEKWKNRPLKIMIYGKGSYEETIRQTVIKNKMDNLVLCGYADNLEEVFSQVQGVVFPSRMEGTPISLIDALLCNRMAIVTPVGGMPEIIIDGYNGFVTESITVDGLDKCLERAWQKRNEWEKMGKEAGLTVRNIIPEFPHAQTINIINKILE